jgi:uncharacterized protein YeaO (DUF488 family)
MAISIKRIQDPPNPDDGLRVFVERSWPRGVKKELAEVSVWAKGVAPSEELLRLRLSSADDWKSFRKLYRSQLDQSPQAVEDLTTLARLQTITLLHSSKEPKKNGAVVLKDYLTQRLG